MILFLASDGKQLRVRRSGAWWRVWGRVLIMGCWLLALLAVPFVALWLATGSVSTPPHIQSPCAPAPVVTPLACQRTAQGS